MKISLCYIFVFRQDNALQSFLDMGGYTTIQRHIQKLESLGFLREVTGKGRNRIYRADHILQDLPGSL